MTTALPLCRLPVPQVDDDAGFGCLRGPAGPLPLRDFRADVSVAGPIWRWRLAQTFVNPGTDAIEAVYIFPLPPRAAVTAFRLRVAGRIVIGSLQERGAARAAYSEAISQGKRAALLEEDRPNVFTIQVGNLQAGETAEVEIELSGAVAVEDGIASVRLPLVVAPRYIPGTAIGDDVGQGTVGDTDAVPDASRITPPVLLPGFPNPVRLAIGISIDGVDAHDLSCSLPTVADGAGRWRIVPGQRLDRDCILRWSGRGSDLTARALIAANAPDGGRTLALSLIPPESAAVAGKPRDVVILLDRSGSMSGWKMVAARRAAARLVDALDARDRFAALAFDDNVIAHDGGKPALHAATDRTRFAAVTWLGGLSDDGGTEMTRAMDEAFACFDGASAERERILVLVTDAQIGDEDRLLKRHAKNLAKTRVVALGVDQAVNESLLERLVAPNGGWQACVESEDWLDRVLALAARAVQPPVLRDLVLETESGIVPMIAPDPVPDAWASRPLTLWARLPGPAQRVTVRGIRADGTPWSADLTPQPVDEAAIHAAWARARIRDLEDRFAVRQDDGLASTITALSLAEGVLCRFTAFVAVDQVVTGSTAPRSVIQPVETPAGWKLEAQAEGFAGAMPPACAAPAGEAVASECLADSDDLECAAPLPEPAPKAKKQAAPAPAPGALRFGPVRSSRQRISPPKERDGAAPPTDATVRQIAEALLQRLRPLTADGIRLALALRSSRTTGELTGLRHLLGGIAEVLAQRLADLLARIAAPASMETVAAAWPELEGVLKDVAALPATGDAQPKERKSWWRR